MRMDSLGALVHLDPGRQIKYGDPGAVSVKRPLAELWRNPDAAIKYHHPPKGLKVEVEIRMSKRAFIRSEEAKMRAQADANPNPFPQDRLQLFECKWGDCDALLDSTKRMKQHVLKNHVYPSTDHICQWDDCGTRLHNVKKLEAHVHKAHLCHYTYICPYQDCSKGFLTEAAWRNHMSLDHPRKEQVVRQYAIPYAPEFIRPIPDLPEEPISPAEVLFLPVRQPPITPEFHRELGPWVLRRILGEVVGGQPRPSSAVSLSPAKGQSAPETGSPSSEHSSIEDQSPADRPPRLPPARYRYAYLNGNTHQIVNRLPPVDLNDIVREPGNHSTQWEIQPTVPSSSSIKVNKNLEELTPPVAAPPETPLFLPDEDEEELGQTSIRAVRDSRPEPPELPLFLPDDDEDDDKPGSSKYDAARPLQRIQRTAHRFDYDVTM
ncbi:hypothetical protein DACRYDRAFT_113112 [Dacryopinax primogenitus]|uniref:C2H2-type domain-containing protein n=1 Tax=Dacryopinax primogenitus (strain DJM 731) TaxID=1858805 RepID=M5GCS8_DACPD|nr:uncharacterized protein DACRYDRAFT_113112 [Dacryopinax primogenitus]EJU06400.1 hypothetical protein DACRYDRAFT_113112 [Dacryopinax primogenitus]